MSRLTSGILAGAVILALVGGGLVYGTTNCATSMSWDLEVGVQEMVVVENGSVEFRGEVGVSGSTGPPRIQGVEIIFISEDDEILESLSLGDFGVDAQQRRAVTATLPERPARIELRAEQIDADPDSEWYVVGVEWTGDQYRPITIQSHPEPWYC